MLVAAAGPPYFRLELPGDPSSSLLPPVEQRFVARATPVNLRCERLVGARLVLSKVVGERAPQQPLGMPPHARLIIGLVRVK